MCFCLYQVIILSSLLGHFNAIEYSEIINATEPEHFINLSAADFETVEEFENVDIKQVIMDELTKNGEQLTPNVVRFLDNPTGESGKLEGDIAVPPDMNIPLTEPNQWNLAYSAVANNRKLWPNGVIPYQISSNYGRFARGQIARAINHFDKKKTCLNFVRRTNETDYLVIRPKIGCSSHIGRMGGRQVVSIAAGCTETSTIVHELMHAAGFYHEQARYDRDNHVIIHWTNVQAKPGIRKQFDKQNESVISLLGIPYDQHSLMHYKEFDFSISPHILRTISAKNGGTLSNNDGLTDVDVMKINSLYDCVNKSEPPAVISITQVVEENDNLTIACKTTGNPKPWITWRFNGEEITDLLDVQPNKYVSHEDRLTLYHAKKTDSGMYECVAANLHGEASLEIEIDVLFGPSFTEFQRSYIVNQTDTVTMKCSAISNPEATITWFTSETEISLLERENIILSQDRETLVIRNVSEFDNGTYQCRAQNTIGAVMTDIQLHVLGGGFLFIFRHEVRHKR